MRLRTRLRPIKHAWQRVTRGWDDSVLWSLDCYLAERMMEWLPLMKDHPSGLPMWCFDRPGDNSDASWAQARAKWGAIVDQMIDGWKAANEIIDFDYPVSYEDSHARYHAGMEVFVEH
ncbi:MAG: hypothetical protein WC657_06950, partial [Candidatus Paceibacterota bacterium]